MRRQRHRCEIFAVREILARKDFFGSLSVGKNLFGHLYISKAVSALTFPFHHTGLPRSAKTANMNMDGRAMQPPPPAAVRDQGQRAVKAPAPRGPVSLPPRIFKDERVKANAVVPLRVDDPTMVRSMTLFPGRIGEVKNGGDEFEIKYDDRTAQVVPAEWIQREDFSWGRTWRDVDEDLAQDKKKKKKRKSPASPPGLHWRLDGFESAFVTPDAEGSMLDRLVFRAKIAYRVKGGQYRDRFGETR